MICFILSNHIPYKTLLSALGKVFAEARSKNIQHIHLITIGLDTKTIFEEYRDCITQSIDVGLRLYIENDPHKVSRIIKSYCRDIYVHIQDTRARNYIKDLDLKDVKLLVIE